jgi:signal transduction histidine kinase
MAAVGIAIGLRILSSAQHDLRPPGVLAYAVGALMTAILPARRRAPLAVLLATVGLIVIYHALHNPGISPVIPLAIPLYAAATAGHLRWAMAAAAVSITATALFTVAEGHLTVAAAAVQLLPQAALLASLVLLGETVRSRRALAHEAQRAARHATLDREREATSRVTEERMRIARELHDVLAHTLAGATIQAAVAADTLMDDPATSRAAVEQVRSACREARAELAATVGVLRAGRLDDADPGHDRSPVPTLAQIDSLLDMGRRSGLRVERCVTGTARSLPPAVDLTAYRIVQESLTNVVRHAAARSVTVSLDYGPATLVVSVTDDGRGDPGDGSVSLDGGGYGLMGMQERAVAVGGRLVAGNQRDRGFQVVATLPATAEIGAIR